MATFHHADKNQVLQQHGVMFRFFRHLAIVEGITTLALFLIAMPAKYWFDYPDLVPLTGLIHGWVFIAYIVTMSVALRGKGFTALEWVRTAIASFFPFGTFFNDPFLKRKEAGLAGLDSQAL
jgi:integral membrane protein